MTAQNLSKKIYSIPFVWIINILILVFVITWVNSLFNGFVWDDEEQIVNNTIIQHLSNFPQIFSGATFGTGGAGLSGWFFRPFLTLSYMLSFFLFGQGAWGYHLISVLLNLANAILVFKILQKLINRNSSQEVTFLNFTLSVLFSIHPVVTEAVDYIASSHYLWMTFFNLLAFLIILRNESKDISFKKYFSVCLLILSGLLFNESSAGIFLILTSFLLIYKPIAWKKWSALLGGTLMGYLVLRLGIIHTPFKHPEFAPISEASLMTRLLTIPKEFLSYLHIIFYPDKLAISQHFIVTSIKSPDFYIPFLIDSVFVLLMLLLAGKFRSKLILFGFLWFGLGFGVISNIIPADMTIGERWIYFPFVGFILMTTGILFELSKILKDKFIFLLVLLLIATVALSLRTIARNSNWQNGLTLYSHDEKISQKSFDLENNLGVELFRNGDYKDAKIHFERSIELQPGWYFTYNNLGAVYEKEGNLQKAKSLYEKTLSLSDYYLAYENIAGLLYQTAGPDKTLDFTLNALRKLPNNANLNKLAALSYLQKGATQSALLYAQRAYALAPTQDNYLILQKISSGQ